MKTIEIVKNDVIFPLFTEELRNHLRTKIEQERIETDKKIKEDGWGISKLGVPNKEFYGGTPTHFYKHFRVGMPDGVLTYELNLIHKGQLDMRACMRVSDVINGKFKLLPLNMDERCFKYFEDFEFDIKDYGRSFYKIVTNFNNKI